MKNISLIINGVLAVALILLYYLHFSSGRENSPEAAVASVSDFKIAYVNADTLLEHYEYIKTSVEIMEAKKQKIESDYRKRAESLKGEFEAYQRNMNNMTIGQVRAVEEDLARKQQNLQLFEQSISQELMNDQARINKELYDRVTAFLKEYGKQRGLMVVLKFDPSSDLLYAHDTLDITQDVLKGLNEAYLKEKAEKDKAFKKNQENTNSK
ncbi:MAG: membrane protein [Cyclobacteriaceae bacterium]|nr:MAG: membrane protein [Cyclobacteriaceae bacterium]